MLDRLRATWSRLSSRHGQTDDEWAHPATPPGDGRGDLLDEDGRRWHHSLVPVTASGWVIVATGVVTWLVGWRLGWIEGMVVAGGCVVALLLAVPFVVGRLRMDVTRDLEPRRVMQGEAALVVLTITNPSSRRVAPRTIEDRMGGRRLEVEVPALGQQESTEAIYNLPTEHRGRFRVGPALIVKADPLGLLRREVVQARAEDFWVHPRHRPVAALPVGYAKDLEGPTSDTSPAGDVAFHNLREYQPGDDYRHIHWLSTARAGTVMVRHYVDNRRPHLGIVLDTRTMAHADDAAFEVAVQVTASLAVSSLVHSQPVVVTAHGQRLVDGHLTGSSDDALDRLAEVQAGEGPDLPDAVAHLKRRSSHVSAVVLVTGPGVTVDELMAASRLGRDLGRVVVVRIGADEPVAIPRARMVEVADLDDFVAAWNRIAA